MARTVGKRIRIRDDARLVQAEIGENVEADIKRQLRHITGVYFTRHCMRSDCWREKFLDPVSKRMRNGRGEFYWDNGEQSFNFYDRNYDMVFPFGLDHNKRKPGYFAFVATCFPKTYERFQQDRFIKLDLQEKDEN